MANQGNNANPVNQGDFFNPLFLHPNESPGTLLVSVPLTGKNYNSWLRAMIFSLKSKNKLVFVDGTLPKPDIADPTYPAWDRCNTFVLA